MINTTDVKNDMVSTESKTHRDNEFGTFEERLKHFCALKEVPVPDWPMEDGEPIIVDETVAWMRDNETDLNWLLCGSPSMMLDLNPEDREVLVWVSKMDSRDKLAFKEMLEEVVEQRTPIEIAFAGFEEKVCARRDTSSTKE